MIRHKPFGLLTRRPQAGSYVNMSIATGRRPRFTGSVEDASVAALNPLSLPQHAPRSTWNEA